MIFYLQIEKGLFLVARKVDFIQKITKLRKFSMQTWHITNPRRDAIMHLPNSSRNTFSCRHHESREGIRSLILNLYLKLVMSVRSRRS